LTNIRKYDIILTEKKDKKDKGVEDDVT